MSGKKRTGGTTGADGKTAPSKPPRKSNAANDIGRALRSAYDDTVREPIPDEFTDLLGKLG